jgi:antitoxin PrlF
MSNAILTEEATLTERYQSTVPASVRKALNLHKGEKIRYTIEDDGRVVLSRVDVFEEDPALGKFLHFLANDISHDPQRLRLFSNSLLNRIQTLVDDVDIDIGAALDPQDD